MSENYGTARIDVVQLKKDAKGCQACAAKLAPEADPETVEQLERKPAAHGAPVLTLCPTHTTTMINAGKVRQIELPPSR